MPFSEVCDKYTIACIKLEKMLDSDAGKGDVKRIEFQKDELFRGVSGLLDLLDTNDKKKAEDALQQLKDANMTVWNAESDLRRGRDGEMTMEEVGRRCLVARDANKYRVAAKNIMCELAGEGNWKDIKTNHASA